jgi:hypothetical protein
VLTVTLSVTLVLAVTLPVVLVLAVTLPLILEDCLEAFAFSGCYTVNIFSLPKSRQLLEANRHGG